MPRSPQSIPKLVTLALAVVSGASCGFRAQPGAIEPTSVPPSLAAPSTAELVGALGQSISNVALDVTTFDGRTSVLSTEVALVNSNTFERATVTIGFDGRVSDEDRETIEHLFRCRRTDRTHSVEPGLLAKVADLAAHFEGQEIEVVSAYRHPPHASRTSRHRHGRAVDLRVSGTKAKTVRDYLWTRYQHEVGVGFYIEQQFVHMDHRPGHPPTAWTQRRENEAYRYDPGWARRIDAKRTRVASAE